MSGAPDTHCPDMQGKDTHCEPREILIWDWPLRVWHWAFALSISASLATGLYGDIGLMQWHLRLGYCAAGLLLFRLIWGLIGGVHSRWSHYRPSATAVINHFRAPGTPQSHTAPGIVLALLLLLATLVQVSSGLYTTDDIFTEGPLVNGAATGLVDTMGAIHHRAFWLVLACICVHLLAHIVYAVRGNNIPLAMFRGRKLVAPGTPASSPLRLRGIATAALVAAAIWGSLTYLI